MNFLDALIAAQAAPLTDADKAADEAAKPVEMSPACRAANRAALAADGFTIATIKAADRCPRCCGRGRLDGYEHVMAGVCFRCGGSGLRY